VSLINVNLTLLAEEIEAKPHRNRRHTCDPLHGRVGTPAACAIREEPILSPSAAIAAEGGPRKIIPFSLRASGSSGFSDACPQPGQTADT
jgi:hypothetical protein